MKIAFYDYIVDVKDLTIGCVLFLISTLDKDAKDCYIPCHLKGFARNNVGELILAVSTGIDEEITRVHPKNLAFKCDTD